MRLLIVAASVFSAGCLRSGSETAAATAGLTRIAAVSIAGPVAGNTDISGVGLVGDVLVVVSDETNHVLLLTKTAAGFRAVRTVPVAPRAVEADLEAVAIDGRTVYVAGSHSRVRPKSAAGMSTIDPGVGRDVIARFTLDADGRPGPVERISLRHFLDTDPVLKSFAGLPGKENGVDIEGLAVADGRLYVGFRGPVLRGNFVPVLVTTFAAPDSGELRYVQLGGRGIRDLARTADGFLILAGPAGDGPASFQIYEWDGRDCLTGADPPGRCGLLTELPHVKKSKPEGLAVLSEDAAGYEVLLASDGPANGNLTRYRVAKSARVP